MDNICHQLGAWLVNISSRIVSACLFFFQCTKFSNSFSYNCYKLVLLLLFNLTYFWYFTTEGRARLFRAETLLYDTYVVELLSNALMLNVSIFLYKFYLLFLFCFFINTVVVSIDVVRDYFVNFYINYRALKLNQSNF